MENLEWPLGDSRCNTEVGSSSLDSPSRLIPTTIYITRRLKRGHLDTVNIKHIFFVDFLLKYILFIHNLYIYFLRFSSELALLCLRLRNRCLWTSMRNMQKNPLSMQAPLSKPPINKQAWNPGTSFKWDWRTLCF